MQLPSKYIESIKEVFKDELNLYLDSFNNPIYKGIRYNTLKVNNPLFNNLEKVKWCNNGYYYENEELSKNPYYRAGLYYIQEPSAMIPAEVLPVKENDRILDLCAAPGGKSTQLLAKLKNTGLLVSNDISTSRCYGLLKNLELFSGKNYLVTNEDSCNLKKNFTNYFDGVLIDAPCSGEGMFHKDASLINSWLEKDDTYYPDIQKKLIKDAYEMLKEGGYLVYSTCTFSTKENEEVVQELLSTYLDASLRDINLEGNFKDGLLGLNKCKRLYPYMLKGEGHFVAIIKKGDGISSSMPYNKLNTVINEQFFNNINVDYSNYHTIKINDKLLLLPNIDINLDNLRIIRSGLLLGTYSNNRFNPSQALALDLKPNEFIKSIKLNKEDIRVKQYLQGLTLNLKDIDDSYNGYVLVCIEDYPLGFGILNNGILKNKIDKGYRTL